MAKKKRRDNPTKKTAGKSRKLGFHAADLIAESGGQYMPLTWYFAHNDGGEERGLNDAGIETFRSRPVAGLAREVIQNSLDARAVELESREDPRQSRMGNAKPVHVKFSVEKLDIEEVPGVERLQELFRSCRSFWPDTETKKFFDKALRIVEDEHVHLLRVSDFNTTGVRGNDRDRTEERGWYSLVKSSGCSAKTDQHGGSFGIGKNAPFAISHLRTVLYSTKTLEGKHSFVGVARLVSHEDEDGRLRQNVGYLGNEKGGSVTSARKIPRQFRRDQPGTDVIILGFDSKSRWKREIEKAVLEHFWLAIMSGELTVQVGSDEINKDNLKAMLEREAPGVLPYYQCMTDPSARVFVRDLTTIGKTHLFVVSGDKYPCKVAMFRNTGMVICYDRIESWVRFAGVFICENPDGSRRLRKMEPPAHDEWRRDLPEPHSGKQTLKEIKMFLQDSIRELGAVDDSGVDTLDELARFLPDDEPIADEGNDSGDSPPEATMEAFPSPSLHRVTPIRLELERIPGKMPLPRVSGTNEDVGGAEHGERPKTQQGRPTPPGEGGERPSSKGTEVKLYPPRAFPTDRTASTLRLIVRPMDPAFSGPLRIFVSTVGDDTREPLRIQGAIDAEGKSVPFQSSGVLGPVPVAQGSPIIVDIKLAHSGRRALEVTACED